MNGLLRHAFYGIGNEHPELGRILWALCVLALIAYQGFAIWWIRQEFSPSEFGIAAASILAAGGFGVGFKDRAVAKAKATGTGE